MSDRNAVISGQMSAAGVALLGAIALFGLLWQLVYRGWGHSFDTAIYAQSLDNIAHGRSHVTTVGLRNLSVHFNLVLYLLAPLTFLLRPQTVLILLQATSFGMIVFGVARHAQGVVGSTDHADGMQRSAAAVLAFLGILCSPILTNPFLFDVRPDLIGAALITLGLLRVHHVGRWDPVSFTLLIAALFVREEWATVLGMAFVFAPLDAGWRSQWRLRLAGSAIAVTWLLVYWFVIRPAMGDGSADVAQEVSTSFFEIPDDDTARWLGYRVEILLIFTFSFGGLTVIGWRWLPIGLPGLALLLATTRMQELLLNFHYVQFCIPAIAVAGADGFERMWRQRRYDWTRGLFGVVGILCFVSSSALPGGGRYRQQNFALLCTVDSPLRCEQAREIAELHTALSSWDGLGIAADVGLSSSIGDRAWVQTTQGLIHEFAEGSTAAPVELDAILLGHDEWASLGRPLAERDGFAVAWIRPSGYALMTRPSFAPARGPLIGVAAAADCNPTQTWGSACVAICGIERRDTGQVSVYFTRSASEDCELATGGLLLAGPPDVDTPAVVPLVLGGGLLSVGTLPARGVYEARSSSPLPSGPFRLELLDPRTNTPARLASPLELVAP